MTSPATPAPAGPPHTAAVHVQAAALQAAFPDYIVTVITRWDDQPRFEAVARDPNRNPYCLISTDVREIWRELKRG